MTDFENKNLNGGTLETPTPETEVLKAPDTEVAGQAAPEAAQPTESATAPGAAELPNLTLEPDPMSAPAPECPIPGNPAPTGNSAATESPAAAFHMPESPVTPEPAMPPQPSAVPQSEPVYNGQQYTVPQYTAPQYQQPYEQQYQQGYQQQYRQPQGKTYYNTPPAGYVQKSRLAAGILGLIFGFLGIHNFYLGFNTKATIQLLVSLLTCGIGIIPMIIWGFVEGVLLLSANPSNPERLYDGNGVILRD